jgi:hypothetical protein
MIGREEFKETIQRGPMNINLDELLSSIDPQPLSITLDGVEHRVRELSVQDVLTIDTLAKPMPTRVSAAYVEAHEAKMRAFMHGLFDGEPPALLAAAETETDPSLRMKLVAKLGLLLGTIATFYAEQDVLTKKLPAMMEAVRTKIVQSLRSSPTTLVEVAPMPWRMAIGLVRELERMQVPSDRERPHQPPVRRVVAKDGRRHAPGVSKLIGLL